MMGSFSQSEYYKLKKDGKEFDNKIERGLNEFFAPKPTPTKTDEKEIELQTIKKVSK